MKLRVLQIIDSLDIGGAEKMAVQLANALSPKIDFSAICVTRNIGPLKDQLHKNVKILNLSKKYALDIKALVRLKRFTKKYEINIIHAHGSSFFMASLLKIISPHLKLVWHDHYGLERSKPKSISDFILVFFSKLFDKILVVKKNLELWAREHLYCKNIELINNFSVYNKLNVNSINVNLKGNASSTKLIHVANFRPQKDHITGLKAIKLLIENGADVSYHLFGNYNEHDAYFEEISSYIKENQLDSCVFIYGQKDNINSYIQLADIGILTSISEGLPLSLIEYAMAKIPIIATDVGEIKTLTDNYAYLFKPKDYHELKHNVLNILKEKQQAISKAESLYNKVSNEYNGENIIKQLIKIYRQL